MTAARILAAILGCLIWVLRFIGVVAIVLIGILLILVVAIFRMPMIVWEARK